MGANDWASEKLILLAEKYPNSEVAQDGKKLLAKLQSSTPPPAPVVARQQESAPPAAASAEPAPTLFADSRPQPAIPIAPAKASGLSGANGGASLAQRFVSCRLGAWC